MQKKSIVKQNILRYIDSKGISLYRFYQESGITRGVLKQDTGISEENIIKFISYCPTINIEWLFTGKGKMLKDLSDKITTNDDHYIKYIISNLKKENILWEKIITELDLKMQDLQKELDSLRYLNKKLFSDSSD